MASQRPARRGTKFTSAFARRALAYAARFSQEARRAALLGMPWYHSETEARHTIARSSLFNRALALETPLAHFACTLMCLLRPVLLPLMPWFMRSLPPMAARDALRTAGGLTRARSSI